MINSVLIGHGAIARYVAAEVDRRTDVRLAAVICREGREDAARAALRRDLKILTSFEELAACEETIVLDCAGHQGLLAHGETVLRAGSDVITLSVGALSDADLLARLLAAADAGGSQLELVPGAVGGVDALAAARVGGLERVTYVGRKPPLGWKGSPAESVLDLDALTESAEHFRGSAREAARKYPKNANVAAMVALAGLGMEETAVSLIADPALSRNRHEIFAEGAFGRLHLEIEGLPLADNPKSSALAAMSMVRAVDRRAARLVL
jgi:aspartate dehydrogenase